jgi:hypothetical protein
MDNNITNAAAPDSDILPDNYSPVSGTDIQIDTVEEDGRS